MVKIEYKEIKTVLTNIKSCSNENEKYFWPLIKDQLFYNNNNNIFKNTINKYLNNY